MRKYLFCMALFLLAFSNESFAQMLHNSGHISAENQQDWYKAGLMDKGVKVAQHIFNVQNAPADRQSDDEKIRWAIEQADQSPGLDIVYLPAGVYTLYQEIAIYKGDIVFQGEGSDKTILKFYNDQKENCFLVRGYEISLDVRIQNPVLKGADQITIESISDADLSQLQNGTWVNFYEANFPVEDYTNTANNYFKSIGQVNRIEKIDGYTLHLKDRVSRTNDITTNNSGDYLSIFKIDPVQNVGIENLKVERATPFGTLDYSEASNFYFYYAVNCWMRGVESDITLKQHVELVFSSHIEISGCYFQQARRYAGGGFGYGLNVQRSTTNCLIENNIFRRLRHSIVLQAGANCNVFTYNYSYDQYSIEYDFKTTDSDLTIHGRYPFGNLFEHNHVEEIECDDEHHYKNNNGPNNTFVRNVARERDMRIRDTEAINLLGNNINDDISFDSNSSVATDIFGRYPNNSPDDYDNWYIYPHRISFYWLLREYMDILFLKDVSYYYSERPGFLPDNITFPSLGPAVTIGEELTQTIPARIRQTEEIKTYVSELVKPPLIVQLNGPDYLKSYQPGTFTVDVSGGTGEYSDFQWFVRNDVLRTGWDELTALKDKTTIQYASAFSFSIKCQVTQSNGDIKSDYKSVGVLRGRGGIDNSIGNEAGNIPAVFSLSNYPNPFNSTTLINLGLPKDSNINIDVFNALGQKVTTLASGLFSAGRYNFKWDGKDASGVQVNSGMYFIIVNHDDRMHQRKTVLLK